MIKYTTFFLWALMCIALVPKAVLAQNLSEDVIRVQLKAAKEARINAPMTGKISKIHFKDGQSVKKGQTLVSFDCGEYNAGLAQARARINKHSKLLDSTQQLFDLGSASQTDIDVLKAELAEAKASRDFSNAKVRHCRVSAPFSGKVASLSAKSHFSIQEGEPIMEVIGTGAMEIEMIIPSKWMRWVKAGEEFNVAIDETGGDYAAKILRLGGRVDPVTQTVKAYGKITQTSSDLLPGMSGEARFSLPESEKQNAVQLDVSEAIEPSLPISDVLINEPISDE